jgi:hypothetical protein
MDTQNEIVTLEKKRKFLEELAASCNVTKAAKAADIPRTVIYRMRQEDPAFDHQVEEAKRIAVEALEDEAHRRAFDGTLIATKHGVYNQYSDTLAIFLLKAHKPDRYMEKVRSELTGANGEPLNLGDDQIAAKLAGIMQAATSRRDKVEAPQEELDEDDLADLV